MQLDGSGIHQELQFPLQHFHYIKYDRAPAIAHENREQPLLHMGLMKMRKIATGLKSQIVDTAFVVIQEIAGLAVDDVFTLQALL